MDHLLASKGHVDPARPYSHLRDLQEHLKESTLKSTRDALANDLERSKCQIKEFEGKVSKEEISVHVCLHIYQSRALIYSTQTNVYFSFV